MTRHLPRTPATLTRAASAGAIAGLAALLLAQPANAQRPPDPEPGFGPGPTVVLAAPAPVAEDGLQIIQIGAGLLAGVAIGATAVAAGRNRRQAHQPRTA